MIWLDTWNVFLFRKRREIFVRKERELRTKFNFAPVIIDGSAWWCRDTVHKWIPIVIVKGNYSVN